MFCKRYINGGGISIRIDVPSPGKTTVQVPDLTVVCQHKDGTPEAVPLGDFKRVIATTNDKEAEMIFKLEAMKEGLKKLKEKYCPDHGCNK
ncbi:hypothetical protein [Akkermansia sp.]|uniref:hypothetical protein n=2 Tax=Akkermansia sp. TaxID=1872421 RepID=UPI00266BAE73|nr:hypothetical protein [Akkermansia sp.]MEE0763609.1 hypothetical protein [Akkermansia sp.]